MCDALRDGLGDAIEFHRPEGGMFVWARIGAVSSDVLLQQAIANKIVFVPGKAFFADNVDAASLRLSFAAPDVDAIRKAWRARARVWCGARRVRRHQHDDHRQRHRIDGRSAGRER